MVDLFVSADDTDYPEPDPAVVKDYCATRGCKVTCQKTNANSCVRYAYYSGIHIRYLQTYAYRE